MTGLSVCLLSQPLTAEEEDPLKPLLLIAFEQDSPDVGWYVQNDNVMGGQSEGGSVFRRLNWFSPGTPTPTVAVSVQSAPSPLSWIWRTMTESGSR